LALPGGRLCAADVHRAGRAGAGWDAHDDAAAGGARGGVEDGRDQSEVAAAHGVSWPTVQRAVVVYAAVELVEPEPATVLGMDETRFGRPRWLPDGVHDDGRSGGCARIRGRPGSSTSPVTRACWGRWMAGRVPQYKAWLAERSPEFRAGVEVVIDPHAGYAAAVRAALPGAPTRRSRN
jgi:transposase